MKHFDTFETCVNVLGVTIAITDIYNILSIILLVISIVSIVARASYKIYTYVKNKKIDKALDEADKLKDDLEDLIDKGGKDNGRK